MSVRDFGDPVRLTSPDGLLEAEFLPKLGMVGRSLRHEGEELLGQRGGPAAYAEQKATFGIPLLHPWANRLGDWRYEQAGQRVTLDRESPVLKADPDTGLPIHGALAASPYWELGGRTFDDSFDALAGEPPTFSVADSRRRVQLRYDEGYPIAQVYAPEDSSFIAFEPMTAPVDALRSGRRLRRLDPGQSFASRFTIVVNAC